MKKIVVLVIFMIGIITLANSQSKGDLVNSATTENIKLFPNPATTVINVLGLKNATNASILISDVYGKPILNYIWEIKNNALNIPIAHIEKGVYMLTIRSEEQSIRKKFIKN